MRRRATITELRLAIESLPVATRVAMLEGISSNQIIVGAYADRGGVCPMLAAHRAGGRTSAIAFAKAWDRFAYRSGPSRRGQRARRATQRELLVLRSHLEASLLEDPDISDLAAAVAAHRELVARHGPDRSRELRRLELPEPVLERLRDQRKVLLRRR
jgi:hypothetical protein